MATIDKRKLKAFCRIDGSGRVVNSSIVFRKNMPKVGRWIEMAAYQCCNYSTTTTTTTAAITTTTTTSGPR